MFFRPKVGVAADVIPFYENNTFKLLYLNDYRNKEKYGEGCPWCLLESNDLVNYKDVGPVILRGSEDEQDLYVFTGSVFKHEGIYYVFYTGHNPHLRQKGLPEQKILLAKGNSLSNLTKVKNFCLEAPDYLEIHDFRDPFVYFDDKAKEFKMLIAARLKSGPYHKRGVTMCLHSKDLKEWVLEEKPFYSPKSYFTHECPDYFKMGDYYYLIFSEFSDKVVTRYVYRKSEDEPWIKPKLDTFDGHAFYAAKSVLAGNKRYLFGWNPIKFNEKDHEFWQWGGNIIPKEIIQQADGTLTTRLPLPILESFSKGVRLIEGVSSNVKKENNSYALNGNNEFSYILFNQLNDVCLIEASFVLVDGYHDFGLMVNVNEDITRGYFIKFDPTYNRVSCDSAVRRDSTCHIEVDTERPLEIKKNRKINVKVIKEGTLLEVFVNDSISMSSRMFDTIEGCFGIYSNGSIIRTTNIRIKKIK